MVFRARALVVSCRNGEFVSQSVCMAATLRRSVVSRTVCGGQLSCVDIVSLSKLCNSVNTTSSSISFNRIVNIWNRLPNDVVIAPSLSSF